MIGSGDPGNYYTPGGQRRQPDGSMTNNSPTLRADSDGRIQLVIPLRQAPPSARLSYILNAGNPPAVLLRLALPGRAYYLIANPLLPAHREALWRLAGQAVVRVVSQRDGSPLVSLFQSIGVRQNLARMLAELPAATSHPTPNWPQAISAIQKRLPAAAEIPAVLEGLETGETGDLEQN